MKKTETSLLATFKTTDAFGDKYAADFTSGSTGANQFALVKTAVTATADLGATQVTGGEETHSSVIAEATLRLKLHTDLLAISNAAHSLVLLGTTSLAGKFHMPRHEGDQELLNTARAFAADAGPYSTQFISLNLPAGFITLLHLDIDAFEAAIKGKGTGKGKKAGATGGIGQTIHAAAIALQVLKTIVANTYKNDPTKLAEWVVASHVEKHTHVSRPATLAKTAAKAAAKNKPATP